MNNVTTIIPVHEYNQTIGEYLDKAIESVLNQEDYSESLILIVSTSKINDEIKKKLGYLKDKISYINNDGDLSYQSQVNLAVNNITTDYFMVLEFDDSISNSYMKNVNNYINSFPSIDIFLSMIIEINERNEGIKITNETVWSQQFVGENGEMGYLNLNLLKQYSDFKLSGAVIKKESFNSIGKYKTKIKLTFMYEFLLRALNNGCNIYSIPKIGYKHLSTRENSMFDSYAKTMSIEERKYWFNTALSEYNFINDRDIVKV